MSCQLVPAYRFYIILLNTVVVLIHATKPEHGIRIVLFDRQCIPMHRLFEVLLHTHTAIKHDTQHVLSLTMIFCSGQLKIAQCFLKVLSSSLAFSSHVSQNEFGIGMPLFCGQLVKFNGLSIVLFHTSPMVMNLSKAKLRFRISFCCSFLALFDFYLNCCGNFNLLLQKFF